MTPFEFDACGDDENFQLHLTAPVLSYLEKSLKDYQQMLEPRPSLEKLPNRLLNLGCKNLSDQLTKAAMVVGLPSRFKAN